MADNTVQLRGGDASDAKTIKLLRRFSSVKVNFEKEKRRTISKFQQHGLQDFMETSKRFQDKPEIRKQLRASVERYSLPELYVKIICALFPQMKSREMPDSNALIQHLKRIFRLSDHEHGHFLDIARMTKLPQRIVNLEIVEARNIPAKDSNGLSDPFCVVFVNTRGMAQRTKIVPKTLNPVWKQYFSFKVNDLAKDVLHVEIMDHNDQNESLRDRIRRLKEIKSPGNFGPMIRDITYARSVQELIGCINIKVSEISSETVEKWCKLKNPEDRGEVYLRMALGYNKSKDTASEEYLQIVHFLLVFELEKDSSLAIPCFWDEKYEVWSKYILRQFKWQGGLKPKDIVLAKWRVYTVINSIFPLNANMMCLLMDSVMGRVFNGEYDTREVNRFWDCAVCLVDTIIESLAELHDVLPCPSPGYHHYLLKTLGLLNQYLSEPPSIDGGKIPFTKCAILERVTKAVREGANKFYLKVFSDCTHDQISKNQDPLHLAVERLIKMGQILHEDLRLGSTTIHNDFKEFLDVDYQSITYQVYDEQFGNIVKHIVEEYNNQLFDSNDTDTDEEEFLDEDSPSVNTGLVVFKLYLSVKNIADLAPPNYLDRDDLSEFSLKRGLYDWFFHSVATWIDHLRGRVMQYVKKSVNFSNDSNLLSCDTTDTFLSKIDKQNAKDVPISNSAIDTAQLFVQMNTFWIDLGWQNPHQSYLIVRKILEELYGSLVYYASQLQTTMKSRKPPVEKRLDETVVHAYLTKGCIEINNINYVKEHVELLVNQLNIPEIIEQIEPWDASSADGGCYDEKIETMESEMQAQVQKIIGDIMDNCVKIASPKFEQLLVEISKEGFASAPTLSMRKNPSMQFKHILSYIDSSLTIMQDKLENQNFSQLMGMFWEANIDGLSNAVQMGLEGGKTSEYFHRFRDLTHQIFSLYWPPQSREFNLETKMETPDLFRNYQDLKDKLSCLGSSLEDLKFQYYGNRYKRQQSTATATNEHGSLTIRTCFVEKQSKILVEILNARKLKSYDSNNSSDPYATVTFVPKEQFPTAPNFATKRHKETLFPLFDELFTFTMTDEERKKGYLVITLYDYDFLQTDDLMGEAFLPLSDISKVPNVTEIETLPQRHLSLCKPVESDIEFLQRFEERRWDKESLRFARAEKEKIHRGT